MPRRVGTASSRSVFIGAITRTEVTFSLLLKRKKERVEESKESRSPSRCDRRFDHVLELRPV